MQFKDIIGHKDNIKHFVKSVNENRVSHALLFTGPRGVGKLNLVLAFAQYISCINKKDNDSCGVCSSCIKYNKLIHPDLHFVYPVVKGKGYTNPVSDNFLNQWREIVTTDRYFDLNDWYSFLGVDNSQGLIYSHESNEIIRKLSLKTYESEYKIMIIWLPEKMHHVTANKLLKMIEEPPEKTFFFMVSEEPENIINTIISRTQNFKISPIENKCLADALNKDYQLNNDELNNIIKLSAGSYKNAKILIENSDENKFNFDNFVKLMRICYTKDVLLLIEWSDEMAKIGREKQKAFLNYAIRLVRENFILNLQSTEMVYLNGEEMKFADKFSPFINENNVWMIAEELSKAFSDIERNGNSKIIFLDLALKTIKLLRA